MKALYIIFIWYLCFACNLRCMEEPISLMIVPDKIVLKIVYKLLPKSIKLGFIIPLGEISNFAMTSQRNFVLVKGSKSYFKKLLRKRVESDSFFFISHASHENINRRHYREIIYQLFKVATKINKNICRFKEKMISGNIIEEIEKFLKKDYSPDFMIKSKTLLMKAVKQGNLRAVKLLLEYGADINITSGKDTAYTIAKETMNSPMMAFLLDHGASKFPRLPVINRWNGFWIDSCDDLMPAVID